MDDDKSRLRRHRPSSGMRIVLLDIKGGTRNVSRSAREDARRLDKFTSVVGRASWSGSERCKQIAGAAAAARRRRLRLGAGAGSLARRRNCSAARLGRTDAATISRHQSTATSRCARPARSRTALVTRVVTVRFLVRIWSYGSSVMVRIWSYG